MEFPFIKKKVIEEKTYLGIFLKEKEGLGFVIKSTDDNLIVEDQEKFTYTNGLENLPEDIDELILKLEERTKTHIKETIFFVYSHFIDEKTKEIKKEYLPKIKELVKNLELKAMGYIECYEAVLHFLEKKEELPLTAVLLELDISNLSVFIYKRGKLAFSKTMSHTENLIDDLLTCFNEIKGKFLLPSRIVLYNTKGLDDESTKILTYHWSEELFIQLPRVEIIKEQEIIDGMLQVFGSQIKSGKEITSASSETKKEEVLGFVVGSDVGKQEPTEEPVKFDFSPIISKINKLREKIFKVPGSLEKKWMIALGVGLIFLGLFLNEYFFHKANVTVYLPYQSINENLNLSDGIKIQTTAKTADFSSSLSTTGKKEIGDKAKGSVTIHNFDDNEKSFNRGTILQTGNLNFILDQDVKVASASVVTIQGSLVKQPGKTKVNVTAQEIGSPGNVAAGKQFAIDGLPTALYFALNDASFTGGSKKEVKIVAKQDIDELKKQLSEKAKQQILNDVGQNKDQSLKLIKQLTTTDLSGIKYNKEIGEEADSLTLQAKVNITLFYYKESDLINKIIENLKTEINKGFSIKKENITYEINKVEQKENEITLVLSVKGKAIKDVDINNILSKIKGSGRKNMETILKKDFSAQGDDITIEPRFPILSDMLPLFKKNINLKISTL